MDRLVGIELLALFFQTSCYHTECSDLTDCTRTPITICRNDEVCSLTLRRQRGQIPTRVSFHSRIFDLTLLSTTSFAKNATLALETNVTMGSLTVVSVDHRPLIHSKHRQLVDSAAQARRV